MFNTTSPHSHKVISIIYGCYQTSRLVGNSSDQYLCVPFSGSPLVVFILYSPPSPLTSLLFFFWFFWLNVVMFMKPQPDNCHCGEPPFTCLGVCLPCCFPCPIQSTHIPPICDAMSKNTDNTADAFLSHSLAKCSTHFFFFFRLFVCLPPRPPKKKTVQFQFVLRSSYILYLCIEINEPWLFFLFFSTPWLNSVTLNCLLIGTYVCTLFIVCFLQLLF